MNDYDNNIIFIAWESHRRTIELCKHFGIKFVAMNSARSRLVKHPYFILKTIYILYKYEIKCLIVQNPSLVLAIIGCIFKNIIGYLLIVDAHNAAILPEGKYLKYFGFLYSYVMKKADITIVTNEALACIVKSKKGNPYILPDKLPLVEIKTDNLMPTDSFNIVCISTFNLDEPYENILVAAKMMPHVNIYMTGNYKKLKNNIIDKKPDNVIFTGYLSDEDYWKTLCSANLIIDLTNRDNCLVCGAYEAAAIEKPMILSDTKTLRKYFSKGYVFTTNSPADIVNSVNYARSHIEELTRSIADFKHETDARWEGYSKNLSNMLRDFHMEN